MASYGFNLGRRYFAREQSASSIVTCYYRHNLCMLDAVNESNGFS